MESLVTWITTHAIALVVGIVVLILVYRYAKPFTHRFVVALLRAQQATLDGGGAPADELRKRGDSEIADAMLSTIEGPEATI